MINDKKNIHKWSCYTNKIGKAGLNFFPHIIQFNDT